MTEFIDFSNKDSIIKHANKIINEAKEHFIAQYLLKTGADIRELRLCHQTTDNGIIRMWLEPKEFPKW